MKMFDSFIEYLSNITTIDKGILSVVILTIVVLAIFSFIKYISNFFVKKKLSGRGEYIVNQSIRVFINIIEVLALLSVWSDYLKSFMTLISVVSAAMTIALREMILNFFCGIYIKVKRPFRVEDRIQVGDIKGDVMNISALDFEILEVSTKEENGQSTGIVVSFPNSIVLSQSVKNINKGFKYIWNELTVEVDLDCDLPKNKQELYKIINSLETVKNIPVKMKKQLDETNIQNRVYFNQFEPIIYTKLCRDHIELTVRYLMHPKKARYVESTIWNKIYTSFREGRLNIYTGLEDFKFTKTNNKKES